MLAFGRRSIFNCGISGWHAGRGASSAETDRWHERCLSATDLLHVSGITVTYYSGLRWRYSAEWCGLQACITQAGPHFCLSMNKSNKIQHVRHRWEQASRSCCQNGYSPLMKGAKAKKKKEKSHRLQFSLLSGWSICVNLYQTLQSFFLLSFILFIIPQGKILFFPTHITHTGAHTRSVEEMTTTAPNEQC